MNKVGKMRKVSLLASAAAVAVGVAMIGTSTASAAPGTIPGHGLFDVPWEVLPGTYTTSGPVSADMPCIYGRAKVDGDGELNVLEFESTLEPATVTILLTDSRFTTAYCADWKRVSSVGSLDLGSLFGS
ncbi:hypothetical protein CPI83_23515 [Rhodococcus sp. H-CA8f]|nr:hypothetical protein CPI83_23515 [Rhodococcus sp. H-CA8f]